MLKEIKDHPNPTLEALRKVTGNPSATLNDTPWNKPILAGDKEGLQKAACLAHLITEELLAKNKQG